MCCGCVRRRPSLEPQESRKGLLYYHKDYLPYETFPGTSSASGAYWTNVQKTNSSCNHNRCSLFLKPFTVAAETIAVQFVPPVDHPLTEEVISRVSFGPFLF